MVPFQFRSRIPVQAGAHWTAPTDRCNCPGWTMAPIPEKRKGYQAGGRAGLRLRCVLRSRDSARAPAQSSARPLCIGNASSRPRVGPPVAGRLRRGVGGRNRPFAALTAERAEIFPGAGHQLCRLRRPLRRPSRRSLSAVGPLGNILPARGRPVAAPRPPRRVAACPPGGTRRPAQPFTEGTAADDLRHQQPSSAQARGT